MATHNHDNEQLQIVRSEMHELESENTRVKEQLKEVTKMNTRWQKYDMQREEYVLQLTKTNKERQDKIEDLERHIERLSVNKSDTPICQPDVVKQKGQAEANKQKGQPEADKQKDQPEADKQKGQPEAGDDPKRKSDASKSSSGSLISTLRNEEAIAGLIDNITQLTDRILTLGKGRESRRQNDDEELLLLREQVEVCIEDFKQERKDRERIHWENEMLRESLAQAEKRIAENEEQIYVYQEQLKQLLHRNPLPRPPTSSKGHDEPCCYPDERPGWNNNLRERKPRDHRPALYYGDDLIDLPSDVEIDVGFDETREPDTNDVTTQDQKSQDEDEGARCEKGERLFDEPLECPRCQASFDTNGYADLLEHIDKCVD